MPSTNDGNPRNAGQPAGGPIVGPPSHLPAEATLTPPIAQQRDRSTRIRGRWALNLPRGLDLTARGLSLVLGAGLVVSGAVGYFTEHSDGLTMILVIGLLMILVPAVVDRLESFEFSQLKVKLTEQLESTGARKTAKVFRRLGIDREIDAYATIFTELRGPGQKELRASLLDQILQRVAAVAAVEEIDPNEVRAMFYDGTPVLRVMALGLMEGNPRLVNDRILLESISHSASGNEQYHGMRLAELYWSELSAAVQTEIKNAVASSPRFGPGTARAKLAEEIVKLR
ncbi:hypothetical protein [Kribbella lupini]|uniref:Uncharacterized protein n=1 Tax=Kribbella lupini TaxID=291602 RepID=A0ABN2A2T3_9ACTN